MILKNDVWAFPQIYDFCIVSGTFRSLKEPISSVNLMGNGWMILTHNELWQDIGENKDLSLMKAHSKIVMIM